MRSRTADVRGPVHVVEWDGPADGPVFVCVHGLGGAHVNWLSLAPLLAARGRVVALDLAGHGRTPLAGRSASVEANRALLHDFLAQEIGAPAILVGNSMGGLISMLEAAAAPEMVAGLVLVDPALPRASGGNVDRLVATTFAMYMVPAVGERLVRARLASVGPDGVVRQTLALCTVSPDRVDPAVVEAQLELARERADSMPWGAAAFLQAARSLVRVLARRAKFMAMVRTISAPTLLIMGRQDRLVNISAGDALARERADWEYVVIDECGHVPQLEYPQQTFDAIERWLDGPAARAIGSRHATG